MNRLAVGHITAIDRLRNSRSGNPRFRITLEVSTYRDGRALTGRTFVEAWNTAADHAFAYTIGNPGFRAGDLVTIAIGGRGTIVDIYSHTADFR